MFVLAILDMRQVRRLFLSEGNLLQVSDPKLKDPVNPYIYLVDIDRIKRNQE